MAAGSIVKTVVRNISGTNCVSSMEFGLWTEYWLIGGSLLLMANTTFNKIQDGDRFSNRFCA